MAESSNPRSRAAPGEPLAEPTDDGPVTLPAAEMPAFRAHLGRRTAEVAAWVIPAYGVAVLLAALLDFAPTGTMAPAPTLWLGWALIGLPLLLLSGLAHRASLHDRYPLLLLLGLAVVGIGWIVLRAGATEAATLPTHGWSLELLFVLLLAGSQPLLVPGLIACALLWALYAALLWSGQNAASVQAADHLRLLQAVVVGSGIGLVLGRLARAEFAARRTLIAHRDRFERIRQSRARFIAAASHDLRQPLHAVAFLSQALRARLKDPPAETVLRRLEQAAQTTDHMIRDLLELTKLDAGAVELRLQPVPLRPLFESVHSEFTQAARSKGLTLHVYKTDLVCRSDPLALQRVVSNLVSNAIRYTDTGLVYLRAEAADAQVRIRVRDTGIGIAPEDRAHLFEEFHQVRKDRGGTGLGLAITRRLCDALDHRLEVESVPGAGSAFTVIVPQLVRAVESAAHKPDAPAAPPTEWLAARAAQPLAGSMVVLVDDDSERRGAVRPVIESWGATVVDAASGAEAEEKLSGILTTPDLMIVDGAMAAGETSDEVIARLQDAYGSVIPSLVVDDQGVQMRAPADSSMPHKIKRDEIERAILAARSTVPRPPPAA